MWTLRLFATVAYISKVTYTTNVSKPALICFKLKVVQDSVRFAGGVGDWIPDSLLPILLAFDWLAILTFSTDRAAPNE